MNLSQEDRAVLSLAKSALIDFTTLFNKGYTPNWHHRQIADKLEAVMRGEIDRLIITMPPRHGKSTLSTIGFPAYFIGHNPDKQIMTISYNDELAKKFGREVRELIKEPAYSIMFDVELAEDSQAKNRFHTKQGGVYLASGIMGSLTGMGADILLIDDPIKNKEEADSKANRDKVYDWFTSTAYTRLEKNGAVVLIQCMTGDTQVLLADGSEKSLRDIQVGDSIATYEDGKLSTSTIKNWTNQGRDCIFTIRMKSGRIVKANERHPFLVKHNNNVEWKKLKDLKTGDKILSVGESGEGLPASTKDVNCQQNARDIVTPTTTKQTGQMGIDQPPVILSPDEQLTYDIDTELALKNTMSYTTNKTESVRCVDNCQGRMCELIGEENSALTTTTTLKKCEDYSVTTATLQLDTERQKKSYLKPLSTYEIIPDEIVEIYESGYEEVFDIEVDRTENFIANGLVSHNTRWHEDDLAGRLIEEGGWDHLDLPAIAIEDEDYRKKGDALWSEKYDIESLNRIRTAISARDWWSLYQQRPTIQENSLFQPEWFRYWDQLPDDLFYVTLVDSAFSEKETADYSVVTTIGIKDSKWYICEYSRGRWNPADLIDKICVQLKKWNPVTVGVETIAAQTVIGFYLKEKMAELNIYTQMQEIKQKASKEMKIQRLVPKMRDGKIVHHRSMLEMEAEFLAFPTGKHDDIIDTIQMCDELKVINATKAAQAPQGLEFLEELNLQFNEFGEPV
jgi:predicted phage terminase large subunit-like protein